MTKSDQLKKIITDAGINVRDVMFLGSIAHIDSFAKYGDKIVDLMTTAGFSVLRITDGPHMDGTSGYRASFRLV